MNTYTNYSRNDQQYGCRDIDASTISEVKVYDSEENSVAIWYDDGMRLRLAARDLLEAAELVVARWEQSDLAKAVRGLSTVIAEAKGGAL